MRAKDSERLGTIRMITAAIKQREVDERITLDDTQVLSVIEKMIKMRKESVAQFQSGGRDDLVAKENKEIELLQAYMPAQLSEAELDALIAAVDRASPAPRRSKRWARPWRCSSRRRRAAPTWPPSAPS